MKYCSNVMFILLWFIAFVNCDNACDLKTGEKKCCSHYQLVNGRCVACPKGWIGNGCNESCPNGYYGVFCKGACNCKDDQICDAQDGCVQNKTVGCQKGVFGEECKLPCPNEFYGVSCKETCNCTIDQICDVQEGCVNNNTDNIFTIIETTSTEQKTTKSNGYHDVILWNHLYGVPLGVVIIVLVILLVHTHRRKKKTSGQEKESRHDQQDQEAGSQAMQLNQNEVQSDYAEISEIDTTYSHTLTFSSDYNVLSFSRSRRDRSESRPTESHYDTSKNCLLKLKESESKSKPDAGGNPYSLAKLLDTGNEVQQAQVSEVKEGDIE